MRRVPESNRRNRSFVPHFTLRTHMRCEGESNPRIDVLQTSAFPLRHRTVSLVNAESRFAGQTPAFPLCLAIRRVRHRTLFTFLHYNMTNQDSTGIIKYMKKKYILIIAIILITIVFFVYRNYQTQQKNKKIEKTQVKRGDLKEEITISGKIKAEEDAILRFQTSGKVSWVGVKEGDKVKKYQIIATLDMKDVKKTLDKKLNTFLKTRTDFDQTQDDNDDKAITDSIKRILNKSQYDLNNTIIDVELQDLAIDLSRLSTPIQGIVVKSDPPFSGVNIIPTQSYYEIVNPETVYFEALADQTEVAKLRNNMKGVLVLDPYLDVTLEGLIQNISFTPLSDETGTVYAVKFIFPSKNTDYRYKLGMTGDLTLITQRKNAVLYLPIKFIKTEEGKKYVFLMTDNKRVKKFIGTGIETDNLIEITSELSEGDIVYD